MRFLIISCICFLLISCSLKTTKGLLEQKPDKKEVINEYFANHDIDYVYKAKLQIFDNNYGGILIIKKIEPDHYRIVFTTEFGNKIFDLDLDKGNLQVKYIVEQLNKNKLIKTLHSDFQLLVQQNNLVEKEFISITDFIYKSKIINKDSYYFYFRSNNQLNKIISSSKTSEKLTIEFNDIDDKIARRISMVHHNFNMKIDLTYINN